MIYSKSQRLMIHGLGQQTATRYKAPDGTIKEGRWVVADGSGGALEPAYALGCYDAPYGVAYATAVLVSTADYDLSGMAAPAGSTVYLSRAGANATPEELEAGVFASVQSDDTGAWSCEGLEGFDGMLWVWIKVPATVLDMLDCGVAVTVVAQAPEAPDEPGAYEISARFSAQPEIQNNATNFSLELTLSGPADMNCIELYAIDPDTGEDIQIPASTSGGGGSWSAGASFDKSGTPYTSFRAVGRTDDAGGTIKVSVVRYEAACLSGSTLITLADGTARRLDQLTAGDLVLGGDMRPAGIIRLARGQWSPRHVLYRFAGGTVIDETHEHRFYNVEQGFWQKLKNWHPGEHALRIDGAETALETVEPVEERAEMFGLWVERGSYWANGLLSGDASANQALLADATAEQAVEMMASLEEKAISQLLGAKEILP